MNSPSPKPNTLVYSNVTIVLYMYDTGYLPCTSSGVKLYENICGMKLWKGQWNGFRFKWYSCCCMKKCNNEHCLYAQWSCYLLSLVYVLASNITSNSLHHIIFTIKRFRCDDVRLNWIQFSSWPHRVLFKSVEPTLSYFTVDVNSIQNIASININKHCRVWQRLSGTLGNDSWCRHMDIRKFD